VIYLYFERLQGWLNRNKPAEAPDAIPVRHT
jgi:hypothetical protein